PGQPVGGGLLGAADPGNGAASAAVTGDEVLSVPGDTAHRLLYADHAQHPHRVRMQRHPGADLLELGRGLVHGDLPPRLRQRAAGRGATDPSADDRYARHRQPFYVGLRGRLMRIGIGIGRWARRTAVVCGLLGVGVATPASAATWTPQTMPGSSGPPNSAVTSVSCASPSFCMALGSSDF